MKRIRAHVEESGALASHPQSRRLAQKKPGNESRDFWRAHDIPVEMEHIWVPVLDEKCPNGYRLQQQQMLFPHRIMSYLFNECHLEIPEADIHQYWDNAIAGGETYASVESRHRVPLGIYGDSAQLITKVQFEKILCFFSEYTHIQTTIDSVFQIFTVELRLFASIQKPHSQCCAEVGGLVFELSVPWY